ncbi:hypothetical protein KVV02_001581 [Mortierella alpina]|uniref:Cytochrome P450 n=1 Tax=Mortierella alpina TaxID=64518 RepID=A0A9P8A9C5_MORAP|nr:hypothetical protein KVV02_001581 [Mortierella alpina]
MASTILASFSSTSGTPTGGLIAALARTLPQILTRQNAKTAVLAYILYALVKYRRSAYGVRPRPDIKGPRGWPLLGNLLEELQSPQNQLLQRQLAEHEKYGSVYSISLPEFGRVINIIDPKMVDHMLRVNFWAYEKGLEAKKIMEPLLGEGIFSVDGEHWKWQRKLASHIFSVNAFRHYTSDVFCREGQAVIKYLNSVADTGRAIDMQQLFYCYTLDSFGEIAFGQSLGCLVDPEKEVEFAAAFDRLNSALAVRFINPFWQVSEWWTGVGDKVKKDAKVVRDFAMEIIQKRRAQDQGQQEQEAPRSKDLLQLFMDLSNEGEPLSDDMLVDSVLNFLIAGRDTTAQALSWTFYLMHRATASPEILEYLVEETDDVLAGGLPTYESTKRQKYAEACFHEALRLYPSVPTNSKICVEDDTLPGGVKVYKGDFVAWNSYAMGRAPSVWGSDAKEYKPERWMDGGKPSSSKFISFHHGPRTCLGQQFATIEAITLMSMLVQHFTFELVDPNSEPARDPLPLKAYMASTIFTPFQGTAGATTSGLTATLVRTLPELLTRQNAKALLLAYALYALVKYRRTAYGVRPRPDIKGPPGWPLVGNLLEEVGSPPNQLLQRQVANHEKYGSIYSFTIPGVGRIINILDPAMVDHMLRGNFWAYEKGPDSKMAFEPLLGKGIFTADGEHWKWQRKLASQIFSVKAFRHYTSDVFCREGQVVIDYLNTAADTGRAVDMQQLFYCYTLDSFGEIAFGRPFGCLVDPEKEVEFAAAFDRLNTDIADRPVTPLWRLKDWWTGKGDQVRKDSKVVRDFALGIIQQRREQEQKHQGEQAPRNRDLLQLFMDLSKEGEALSDDALIDSVLNFVIAGRDTTAQALSWTFYLMHRSTASPKILEQLVNETDDVLAGGLPTYESTKHQKYAEACFYEALRLYPSVPKNGKICVEDDILPDGTKVYKGERIGWSSYAMGRATSVWGPDAKEYKPERWMNGEKPSSSKFISFHHGPRTCLGQQFATIEAITLMSMLVQHFTFELVDPNSEPAYVPSLTLPMQRGLPIRVKRRTNTPAARG